MSKLTAVQDVVIVKPDPPVERVGSIWIPEAFANTLWSGLIVAIGPGRLDGKGRFRATSVRPGDYVVIDTAKAVQITYQGEELMVTREPELLGIITEEGTEILTWKNENRMTRREWEDTMKAGVVRKTA